jgi:hypothetical protein
MYTLRQKCEQNKSKEKYQKYSLRQVFRVKKINSMRSIEQTLNAFIFQGFISLILNN